MPKPQKTLLDFFSKSVEVPPSNCPSAPSKRPRNDAPVADISHDKPDCVNTVSQTNCDDQSSCALSTVTQLSLTTTARDSLPTNSPRPITTDNEDQQENKKKNQQKGTTTKTKPSRGFKDE